MSSYELNVPRLRLNNAKKQDESTQDKKNRPIHTANAKQAKSIELKPISGMILQPKPKQALALHKDNLNFISLQFFLQLYFYHLQRLRLEKIKHENTMNLRSLLLKRP